MHRNGESIEFLEEMERRGKVTALSDLPELDEEEQELWELYCFAGDNILIGVDIYASRIGLPWDWPFQDCIRLLAKLSEERHKLVKAKRERDD